MRVDFFLELREFLRIFDHGVEAIAERSTRGVIAGEQEADQVHFDLLGRKTGTEFGCCEWKSTKWPTTLLRK